MIKLYMGDNYAAHTPLLFQWLIEFPLSLSLWIQLGMETRVRMMRVSNPTLHSIISSGTVRKTIRPQRLIVQLHARGITI